MAQVRRSIFGGKEYLDLVAEGKQLVVDKLVYITKHKELVAGAVDANAGTVTVYGMPEYNQSKDDLVLIDHQKFNLPRIAGEYCETVIDTTRIPTEKFNALIIDIDWEGDDGTVYLEDVGTEIVKYISPITLVANDKNEG